MRNTGSQITEEVATKSPHGGAHLVRVQQAVVDTELHELRQQIQDLLLQEHRRAGGVLLKGLDDQRLKEPDVIVDGVLCTGDGEEKRKNY